MAFTPADLPSLSGHSAVVTGANSGIGYFTALELARHGAAVTLACRTAASAEKAADRIRVASPGAAVSVASLNLASLRSVADFARGWDGPLHLLINNAGVMAPPTWRPSEEGFELQFATNHLGHFALTAGLLPALLATESSRVVTVSSLAHRNGDAGVLFGNSGPTADPKHGYVAMKAYANSKLANLLFGLELQRRADGTGLSSTVAHPGISATNLFRSPDGLGANPVVRAVGAVASRVLFQPANAGANPTLYAACLAAPGSYTGPRWFGEVRGPAVPASISNMAQDESLAAQLWDLSEELTRVSFQWPSTAAL